VPLSLPSLADSRTSARCFVPGAGFFLITSVVELMTMVEEVNLVVGLVAAVVGATVFMIGFGLTFKGPERLEPVAVVFCFLDGGGSIL